MSHKFLTNDQLQKYDQNIDNDPRVPQSIKDNQTIREVCRAGLWLIDELQKLHCPDELLVRLQYTAGKLSYGNDPWLVHQDIVDKFKNNQLEFEDEPNLSEN